MSGNELATIIDELNTAEVSIKALDTFPVTYSTVIHVRNLKSLQLYLFQHFCDRHVDFRGAMSLIESNFDFNSL